MSTLSGIHVKSTERFSGTSFQISFKSNLGLSLPSVATTFLFVACDISILLVQSEPDNAAQWWIELFQSIEQSIKFYLYSTFQTIEMQFKVLYTWLTRGKQDTDKTTHHTKLRMICEVLGGEVSLHLRDGRRIILQSMFNTSISHALTGRWTPPLARLSL